MSGRRLFVLIQQMEYMCVALGGQPDKEIKNNKQILDDFEDESKGIQEMLKTAKSMILKRVNVIRNNGHRSKQRVLVDEKLNKMIKESEANLEVLKLILRDFTADNYEMLDKEEFNMRASKLELLEQNLKIVKDEYMPIEERALLQGHNDSFADEEMRLNRDSPIYVTFDKNDAQINQISSAIGQGMAVLKEKMETLSSTVLSIPNIHLGPLQHTDTLAKLNKRSFWNYKIISEQKSSLLNALEKTKENYMTPVANKTLNVAAKGFLYKTNQSGKG